MLLYLCCKMKDFCCFFSLVLRPPTFFEQPNPFKLFELKSIQFHIRVNFSFFTFKNYENYLAQIVSLRVPDRKKTTLHTLHKQPIIYKPVPLYLIFLFDLKSSKILQLAFHSNDYNNRLWSKSTQKMAYIKLNGNGIYILQKES